MIEEFYHKKTEPVIFLDSCVCLHIIKVIDHKKLAKNIDFSRLLSLKEYLSNHPNIRINPIFALLELCSLSSGFDSQKLHDFKLRIDFFEQLPFKHFKNFRYDFYSDFLVIKDLSKMQVNRLEAVDQVVKNSYCTLLKIRSIAIKNLSKNKAESNINELSNWMINDLNIFRGAEYKLALNIFGGNTEFRKMIGLDSKPKDIKKKIWGSSWDMFHSKFSANGFRLSQILERNIYPFFLTSDANLFKIFQNLTLEIIKDGRDEFVSSFIMTSDSNFPHYEETFFESNSEKLLNLFVERRNNEYSFNEEKVNELILDLEIQNGIVV